MGLFSSILRNLRDNGERNSIFSQYQLHNKDEISWKIPKDTGTGQLSITKLRPGVVMGFANCELSHDVQAHWDVGISPISFAYSTSGDANIRPDAASDSLYSCRSGHELFFCLPMDNASTSVQANSFINNVGIYIDPSVFFDVFPTIKDTVPKDVQSIANGDSEARFYQKVPASTNVQMVVHDILTCPYCEPYRRMFLENKAMELMTHTLWRTHMHQLDANRRGLRSDDLKRVSQAKQFMDQHFCDDIKLHELSRRVGMSHDKLNLCFRQIHGTTVFGYLRELRMKEARFLLSQGDVNVTEAAYSVGYTSLSHFAKVFKKQYGQAPRDYLRVASKPS